MDERCCLTLYLCDVCNGQIQYKESVGQGTTIPDLPEVKRVRETQKNISLHRYKEGVGQGTSVPETPEMERVKRNQQNISTIKYKDSLGRGTAIPDLPEVKRVRETQRHISSVVDRSRPPCAPNLLSVDSSFHHDSSPLLIASIFI
uniref:Uncharacterized protein n=1 Tax=Poecilia mexicana TaxID=48701 RepID=A0A3B3XC00_9TELE